MSVSTPLQLPPIPDMSLKGSSPILISFCLLLAGLLTEKVLRCHKLEREDRQGRPASWVSVAHVIYSKVGHELLGSVPDWGRQ